jgi:hypothetical protein
MEQKEQKEQKTIPPSDTDHIGDQVITGDETPGFSLTSLPENPFGLRLREQVFVACLFLTNFNASKSYELAGFKPGRHNAARLFAKKRIQQAIKAKLAPKIMLGDEALERITLNARFDPRKLFPLEKKIASLPDDVALAIKAVTPTKHGLRIEWHDAQRAAELLAKAAGRLKETIQVDHTLEEIMAHSNESQTEHE